MKLTIANPGKQCNGISASQYPLDQSMSAALGLLYRAYRYSVAVRSSPWQFAVEIDELLNLRVTRNDLRWLMAIGLIAHACEIPEPASKTRKFTGLGSHYFLRTSCFVLSDQAVQTLSRRTNGKPSANNLLKMLRVEHSPPLISQSSVPVANCALPEWDLERRQLRLGDHLIKQFRGRADNQERIVRAFHEEKWAVRIDDPLPPAAGRDSRRRLNDAIKNLNRHQANSLILFRGDGTGCGILWELREETLEIFEFDLP